MLRRGERWLFEVGLRAVAGWTLICRHLIPPSLLLLLLPFTTSQQTQVY